MSPHDTFEHISNDVLEGVVEKSVQERIGNGGQHPEEEGQGVAHRDDDTSLRKDFWTVRFRKTNIFMMEGPKS